MTTHAATAQPSYLVDTGSRKGLMAWLTTTDHKRIGLLYLVRDGHLLPRRRGHRLLMRLVQLTPFQHLITAQTYNALFTLHGVIMIFLFVIPGLPAVVRQLLPAAPDRRQGRGLPAPQPRSPGTSSWPAPSLAVTSLFTGGGAPGHGLDLLRALQPPDRHQRDAGGVRRLRARASRPCSRASTSSPPSTACGRPGMTWFRMPLFAWALYATAWVQLLATPIIGHHAAAGHPRALLRHRHLRPGQGRRSDPLPAPVLDLLAPGGLHHDPAGHGRHLRDHPHLRPAHHLRLQGHRLLEHGHRRRRLAWSGPTTCSPAA